MSKTVLSLLSATCLATAAVFSFGGHGVAAEGPAGPAFEAGERRDHENRERKFGPFRSRGAAQRKCHFLEREGWHCRVKYNHGKWYVFAWRDRGMHSGA